MAPPPAARARACPPARSSCASLPPSPPGGGANGTSDTRVLTPLQVGVAQCPLLENAPQATGVSAVTIGAAQDRPAQVDPVADRPSSSCTPRWVPRRRQLVVGSEPEPLHQV